MIQILFAAAVTLLAATPATAEDATTESSLKTLCQEILCRPPGAVHINLRSGKSFETSFSLPSPIVQDGQAVSIFPGEEHFVEAVIQSDGAIALRAVAVNEHPDKTITLKMWQEPGKADTYLVVRNPLPKSIKYSALMMSTEGDNLYKTSSCPVMGEGKAAYEHWPHEIFQLVLVNFRALKDDSMACEF